MSQFTQSQPALKRAYSFDQNVPVKKSRQVKPKAKTLSIAAQVRRFLEKTVEKKHNYYTYVDGLVAQVSANTSGHLSGGINGVLPGIGTGDSAMIGAKIKPLSLKYQFVFLSQSARVLESYIDIHLVRFKDIDPYTNYSIENYMIPNGGIFEDDSVKVWDTNIDKDVFGSANYTVVKSKRVLLKSEKVVGTEQQTACDFEYKFPKSEQFVYNPSDGKWEGVGYWLLVTCSNGNKSTGTACTLTNACIAEKAVNTGVKLEFRQKLTYTDM